MSSLAGALIPPDTHETASTIDEAKPTIGVDVFADDVEMHSSVAKVEEGPAGDILIDQKVEEIDQKVEEEQDEPMADLFGDDNEDVVASRDERSATSPTASGHMSDADGISSHERKHRKELEYEEEDAPNPEYEQVLEAAVQIPNIPVPRASDGNYWVIRTPNFVQVDSKPFHPDTYVGPENEDEDGSSLANLREKSMTIKLKVENTVRWRWVKDKNGIDERQSNSRIIRWSDGTLSLLLGKELFDITQTIDTSGTVPRQSLGGSQAPTQSQQSLPTQPSTPSAKSQGLTYLVAQHKRAFILQSEAVVTGYMSLRPTGMQSETHRMLVRAVGQKHNKVARLRMAPDPITDPEKEKMELMKLAAKKPKRARMEEDGLTVGRRRRGGSSRKRTGDMMWSDEEDEEVDFDGSEDDQHEFSSSPHRGKNKVVPADPRKGAGDYQPDDFLVADESEEEGSGAPEGNPRKRMRRGGADEEVEEDALDKLEAKIEQVTRQQQRRRGGSESPRAGVGDGARGGNGSEGGEEMDIESEEEEAEEFNVRKAGTGTGSRKKRALMDLDEEEE